MIVVVGGEKGGSGKTTIAVNLAAMRMKDKGDTLLVDAEVKNAHTVRWCASRKENEIQPFIPSVYKIGATLHNDILTLGQKFSTVIVDVGQSDSVELRGSLLAADVVVIPIQPNDFDLWTLDSLEFLTAKAKVITPKIRTYVLLTRCHPNPLVPKVKTARETINNKNYQHLILLPFEIYDRQIYTKTTQGKSVHEFGTDRKAENELENLYKEIFNV